MTLFKTNAGSLEELDIALAELHALSTDATTFDDAFTQYVGKGEIVSVPDDLDQAVDRVAMCNEFQFLKQDWRPTQWKLIQNRRYDTSFSHSTHSLFPFTGKLEPRLARACINLAIGRRQKATVVDPFCGSGTVLLEANLMGFNTIGADIDPFACWLSAAKLTPDTDEFEQAAKKLNSSFSTSSVIARQREACPPRPIAGTVNRNSAEAVLRALDQEVDAIVTSPPYYDAIDYNSRHAEMRRRLDLGPPTEQAIGTGQAIFDYAGSISKVAKVMVSSLKPKGRIVIVAASYHGVDTTDLYFQSLLLRGMREITRLRRSYRVPVMGIGADEILVMEKS